MKLFNIKKLATAFLWAAVGVPSCAANSDTALPVGTACVLAKAGEAKAIIVAPARVMQADNKLPTTVTEAERTAEQNRRRLRESVLDLRDYLGKISGGTYEIRTLEVGQTISEAEKASTRIYIGELASAQWGVPKQPSSTKQAWQLVAGKGAMGIAGQSDESCSYAIYELLEGLGCRWYMPSALGEVVPKAADISFGEFTVTGVPSTEYRGIWYGDDAFKRRTRQGGFLISAGHALEGYITSQQREAHPEWRAIIGGKPHPTRLKWSSKAVSDAVADGIIERLEKNYTASVSLSPDDGAEFDETDDTRLDAGDWDPAIGTVSITDRYVNFANRVAERVTAKFPEVKFGFLAYVQYTRPPVREKLHPSLIPQIAPITFCRAHAFVDADICPSRAAMKPILEGWAKAAPQLSYYNYMFHLAETSVPYPMMDQMSKELPVIFQNHATYWQPETTPNFDSVLPGMTLAIRMSWNKARKPQEVLDEFFQKFYGECEVPMRTYWEVFDKAWATSAEHAGCGWGYAKRFPPEVLKRARMAMDEALNSAHSPLVYRRVKLQDDALRQFERFMEIRYRLNDGRLSNIDLKGTEWLGTQMGLAEEYAPQFAFNKVGWTPHTIAGTYFRAHYEQTLKSAAEIVRRNTLISGPLRRWSFKTDPEERGNTMGWQQPGFEAIDWTTTDSGTDTWFDLGLGSYFGTGWYRQKVKVPQVPDGKKVFLWLAATDGDISVYLNGQLVPYLNGEGQLVEKASGYAIPITFDVTNALRPGAESVIVLKAKRTFLNEMGTGGLMGPAYLYRER